MRSIPTDIKLFDPQEMINKYTDIIDNMDQRTGPNILWMPGNEDDTKIRTPSRNFLDGIPTINQVWSDYVMGLSFIAGRANHGKAQPLTCKVLTPSGFRRMGDLKVGDFVLTPKGKSVPISHIFNQGVKSVLKITLTDGSFTYCCPEHLWTVKFQKTNFTFTAKQIFETLKLKRTNPIIYSLPNLKFCPDLNTLTLEEIECFDDLVLDDNSTFETERIIESVTESHTEECQCIVIDDPEHLYITDNFIVTHNSTIITNLQVEALRNNDDVLIVDISLDDPPKKRYQQYLAKMSGLKYSEVTHPKMLTDSQTKKLFAHQEELFDYFRKDKLITLGSLEKIGTKFVNLRDYKTIGFLMSHLRDSYPDKKIAVFVDAWNDIDMSSAKAFSEVGQGNEVLSYLKQASEQTEIILSISAHIRKTLEKRISIQDIKGTSNIEYSAVSVLLVRNEYREGAISEPLMYDVGDIELPILTLEVAKTKVSEWDLPLLYPTNFGTNQIISPQRDEYKQMYTIFRGKRK